MTFHSALRSPSWYHKKEIDITDEERSFEWICVDCKEKISVPLKERLKHGFEQFPSGGFTEEEKKEIKEYYALGPHSRSPCGGGFTFERIECPLCEANYLFTCGIDEPSNSYLVLTVQGIVHINKAEPGSPYNSGQSLRD